MAATQRGGARRDRVLKEAARQLNAGGVSQMSLNDVADHLGVSRAALYYYCEDRADLVYQCYRYACGVTARRLEEAFGKGVGLREGFSAYLRHSADDPDIEPSYISEIGYLRPEHRAEVVERIDHNVSRLAEVIERATASGEVRGCDAPLVARTLLNMASFLPFARHWGINTTAVSRAQAVAAVESVVAGGWVRPGRDAAYDVIDLTPLKPRATEAFDRNGLAEAKHEAILAAASRLFNQQGVDTTSLDEIAAALGSTKRTLYHHIGDKGSIVAACYRRAFKIHFYLLDRAETETSAAARFSAYHHATCLAQISPELSPLRPLDGLDLLGPDEQTQIRALAGERTSRLRALWGAGQADGSLRDTDHDAAMMILPGATSWMSKGLLAPGADANHAAREVTALLQFGLDSKRAG